MTSALPPHPLQFAADALELAVGGDDCPHATLLQVVSGALGSAHVPSDMQDELRAMFAGVECTRTLLDGWVAGRGGASCVPYTHPDHSGQVRLVSRYPINKCARTVAPEAGEFVWTLMAGIRLRRVAESLPGVGSPQAAADMVATYVSVPEQFYLGVGAEGPVISADVRAHDPELAYPCATDVRVLTVSRRRLPFAEALAKLATMDEPWRGRLRMCQSLLLATVFVAHHGEMVHRDIKPDNVVFTEELDAAYCDMTSVVGTGTQYKYAPGCYANAFQLAPEAVAAALGKRYLTAHVSQHMYGVGLLVEHFATGVPRYAAAPTAFCAMPHKQRVYYAKAQAAPVLSSGEYTFDTETNSRRSLLALSRRLSEADPRRRLPPVAAAMLVKQTVRPASAADYSVLAIRYNVAASTCERPPSEPMMSLLATSKHHEWADAADPDVMTLWHPLAAWEATVEQARATGQPYVLASGTETEEFGVWADTGPLLNATSCVWHPTGLCTAV